MPTRTPREVFGDLVLNGTILESDTAASMAREAAKAAESLASEARATKDRFREQCADLATNKSRVQTLLELLWITHGDQMKDQIDVAMSEDLPR